MRPTHRPDNAHHSHDGNNPNSTKNSRKDGGGFRRHFRSYKRVSVVLAAFVVAATLSASLVIWRVQAQESDGQSVNNAASAQSQASLPMPSQRLRLSAPDRILAQDPFAPSATASAFTSGNLVVCRIGDGLAALTGSATAVFLDEYTSGGTLVQSIPMPTAVSAPNQILTASGTATNECHLTRSSDGRYLIVTGYNAAVGTATIATSNSTTFPRVIGRVDAAGAIDTSTTTTSFNGGGIRSATTDTGTNLWAVGSNTGVVYNTLSGSGAGTIVSSTATNFRVINNFGGQLYIASGAGTLRSAAVGTGLPTGTGNTTTSLPGMPTASATFNGFFFADLDAGVAGVDTLYIANDAAAAVPATNVSGGILKFALVGGTWTYKGTFPAVVGPPAIPQTAFFGLAGSVSGGTVTLYATRNVSTTAFQLVSVVDATGYNVAPVGVPTQVATNATNQAFRSVAFAPVAPDVSFSADGNLPAGTYHDVTITGCPTNVTLTGNVTVTGTFRLEDCSNLYTNNFIISGSGSFVMDPGTWLHITSAQGITSGATLSGNIQVTGGRTFDSAANYDYDGSVNQVVGNGLPSTVNDLLISNSGASPNNVVTGNIGQAVTTLIEVIQGVYSSASDYNNVQIDAGGTLSLAGDITVSGNWTNNGTFNANTFRVTFDGNTPQSISGSTATLFAGLTISNSADVVTLNQNASDTLLDVTSGTFSQGAASNLNSGPVNVSSGTWSNLGTGDLTLSGGVNNLGTITFNAHGTTCGEADDILIRSSDNVTQRSWTGTGTFNMTDVDVKDQGGTAPITVRSGTNSGNNGVNWLFIAACTGATYTWNGATLADWNVGANWTPTRVTPDPADVMVFNGAITPGPMVSNVPTQTIAALRIINGAAVTLSTTAANTLTINGATGSDLTVPVACQLTLAGASGLTVNVASGSTATIGGLVLFQDGPHRLIGGAANAITFQSGSICTTAPSYTATVNPFGTGGGGANGATGSVVFQSGSNYFHNNGESPFGALVSPAVAVFQTGSTATWLSSNGFQGRTYSNLVIGKSDPGGIAVTITSSGTDPFEFDDLIVNSTPTVNSSLTFSGDDINIKGWITSNGVGDGTDVPDVTLLSASTILIQSGAGLIEFTNDSTNARKVRFEGNATVHSSTTLVLFRKLVVGQTLPSSVITVAGALTNNGFTGGYVIGKEKRAYTAPELFTYYVGTTSGYSRLDANVTAGTGDLTVEAKQPQQPVLNAATSLQRYWTLTEGGAITAGLVFHYNDADVAGNEANYRLVVVEGSNATSFPEVCPGGPCVDESANTITQNGVTTFSDWTAAEPAAPTAVKLSGFTAVQNNGEVMLRWQSGYEASNLGYNIYREQDGKRVPITPSLIAGSALIAGRNTEMTAGLTYTWYDEIPTAEGRQATAAVGGQRSAVTYWLEDVDLDGTCTLHGPIAIAECGKGNGACRKLSERSRLLSEVTNAKSAIHNAQGSTGVELSSWPAAIVTPESDSEAGGTVDPAEMQRTIAGLPGLKISVSRPGWYRITQPEVLAAGFNIADANGLQLYRDGRQVAFHLSNSAEQFGPNDYLEFYGEGLSSTTASAQTYYLVKLAEAGKRIEVKQQVVGPSDRVSPQGFAYTVERKERMVYFSGLLNGDAENFFGQILNSSPTSATIPISHLDASSPSAPAQLEVVLQGVTSQSHLVRVRFNGTDLGTMSFDNTEHPSQTLSVPAAALQDGNNTVELTSLGGTADVSLVDVLRLTYRRSYTADNNALSFNLDSRQTKRLTGFTNGNIRVIDVTDAYDPLELTPYISPDGGGFAALVGVDVEVRAPFSRPHKLLAFTDGQADTADGLRLNETSSWWSQTDGADYLIITTRALMASVEPLAQLRRNQGMLVQIVDVEDLYDEFSFGEHSPQVIHDFLARAMSTWTHAPHYVLLAGDASYDPKNYFGLGSGDLVPTKLIDTALTETASDDWLADFNHDGMADLAMGRLPLRTVAEVNAMVGKIVSYESAAPDPSRGALLVADTSFEAASSEVQSLLPAGMAVQSINRSSSDDATIHSQIVAGINQGPRVTNYIGHGSNGVWTAASLLSNIDAPSLTNTNRLSVFTMMTCFNGYFQDPQNDSLSEALLKSPGGAVAVWASTTLTEPSGQNAIDQEFYRLLFAAQPATLGDAARAAKVVTNDADVRRTWTLFGDPAMRLR